VAQPAPLDAALFRRRSQRAADPGLGEPGHPGRKHDDMVPLRRGALQMSDLLALHLDRPTVQAAPADLRSRTRRRVRFEHVAGLDAADLIYSKDEFLIRLDGQAPLVEHSIVHELCHAIMFEEGYPLAMFPSPEWFPLHVADQMSCFLTNQFHHCDVF